MINKVIYAVNNTLDRTTAQIISETPKRCSLFVMSPDHELYEKGELVKVSLADVPFTEKLSDRIISIVLESHEQAKLIQTSNEFEPQQYGIKVPGKIEGVVSALVNKCSYDSSQYDLFDLLSILLFRLTKAHAFHNGNKRTSIITIARLLKICGFYLS